MTVLAPWDRVQFGTLARVGSKMVSPLDPAFSNLPHVGPENIESGRGHLIKVRTAAECQLVSGKYIFDEQALIYSKIRPNLNKVAWPRFRGLCSADAYPIWPDENKVDTEFLAQAMRSREFVKQAVAVSARTGMPKINREDLAKILIPVPPLRIQRIIGELLSALDLASDQMNRLVRAKGYLKSALMRELLSGRRRFPGFENEDWREVRLGDVFTERDESAWSDLPLLAITGDRGVVLRDQLSRRDSSAANKSKYKRIVPGDIGYNTMRMWQGVSALSRLEGIVSPAYTIVVPNSEVDGRFVAPLFKLPAVIDRFRRHSQGLVDDTLNLKYPQFAKVRVTLPSVKEQSRISDLLDAVALEIEQLRSLRSQVEKQKDALLESLLSRKLAF